MAGQAICQAVYYQPSYLLIASSHLQSVFVAIAVMRLLFTSNLFTSLFLTSQVNLSNLILACRQAYAVLKVIARS